MTPTDAQLDAVRNIVLGLCEECGLPRYQEIVPCPGERPIFGRCDEVCDAHALMLCPSACTEPWVFARLLKQPKELAG